MYTLCMYLDIYMYVCIYIYNYTYIYIEHMGYCGSNIGQYIIIIYYNMGYYMCLLGIYIYTYNGE
jgi:hypothetical protein